MRNKKGFTLVELIIVIAILGIILSVSFNMMLFGVNAHKKTLSEYELQSSIRIASERTNDIVKYSSSLFTIPEGSFRKDNLDKEWDYFGLSEDRKQIIHYKANPSKVSSIDPKFHDELVVVDNQDGIEYDFIFKKNDALTSSNLLEFTIEARTSDNKKVEIITELNAINSGFVKDYGTSINLANAIAFRSDRLVSQVPAKNKVGVITMVLDVSGSMGDKLGGSTSDKNKSKISLLKDSAKNIVDGFASEKDLNLQLSIVPFSTSANYPYPTSAYYSKENHPFYDLSIQPQVNTVKSVLGNFNADGGTNTGDGLRRAYYNTVTKKNSLVLNNKDPKNYLIVLVDGVSTFSSVKGGGYFTQDGYLSDLTWRNWGSFSYEGVMGEGNELDYYATQYVNLMGKKSVDNKLYDAVYVIGFSSKVNELESVNDIAEALGITNPESSKNVFKFTDTTFTLDGVFDSIREDIVQQLWRVEGPKF